MNQRKLKTNFAINVVGTGLPFVVALVTIPLYIAQIGTARFGVIAIVWILLGYFGFIDLGLSRASANALAKLAGASHRQRIRVLLTSLYLNAALGIAGGLALYFSGSFLMSKLLPLGEPLATELNAAFPWIAALLPLLLLIGVCRGAIESNENFLAANVIDLVGYVLGQVLPLLAAIFIAPTLPVVLAAAFIARMISTLMSIGFVALTEKINKFWIFDRDRFKQLIGYGAWAGVTGMIAPVLQFLDQLLVGSVLGPTAVAHYAVPMNLVVRSQIVAAALSRAMFPRFSRMSQEKATELGESAVVSLGFIYGAICAAGIVLSTTFMHFWIGSEFASEAAPVLKLLLVGAWINGIAFIPYGLLQGQGRPDLVAKIHALEIIPYLLLLLFALYTYGIFGAALAWNIRVAIDAGLLLKFAGFRARKLGGVLLAFILILAAYAATYSLKNIGDVWSICIAGFIFMAFVGIAMIVDENVQRAIAGIPPLTRTKR